MLCYVICYDDRLQFQLSILSYKHYFYRIIIHIKKHETPKYQFATSYEVNILHDFLLNLH